ncbi:MAG: endonuclease/exonuclease/phosphatase family protein [Chloroflexi bacterium]|nr:endonuclease/exonuclease/phosphatase family protein [Chloroflexota bacterium]
MNSLTVATINLRQAADRWRERRHLLVSQIVDTEPDLISLQEVYFPIRQGPLAAQPDQHSSETNGEIPYRLVLARKRHLIKGYYEGIGILTKAPVRYKDVINLGYGGRVALRINVALPSNHTLDFVAVHLHHEAPDKEARKEQTMRLTGWLNNPVKNSLQVIAGDFNETPDGPAIQFMKQGYRSAYEAKYGREPYATFPTALRLNQDNQEEMTTQMSAVCLDYIFVSKAVKVKKPLYFAARPVKTIPFFIPQIMWASLPR